MKLGGAGHAACPACSHCAHDHVLGSPEPGTAAALEIACIRCLPFPCDATLSPADLSVLRAMMFKATNTEMITETGI